MFSMGYGGPGVAPDAGNGGVPGGSDDVEDSTIGGRRRGGSCLEVPHPGLPDRSPGGTRSEPLSAFPGPRRVIASSSVFMRSRRAVTSRPGNSRNSSLLGSARCSGHCANSQPTIAPEEIHQRTLCRKRIDLRKHTPSRRKEQPCPLQHPQRAGQHLEAGTVGVYLRRPIRPKRHNRKGNEL